MKLYGDRASPYVTRVIMYAGLKGLPVFSEPVPGGNPRSAQYHAINPLGKVPGLLLDGEVMPESEVICEYLEDAYPQPPGLPESPRERATSRLVARITDLYISPNFAPLLPQLDPAHRNQGEVERLAAAFGKAFRSLEHYMGPGPFCVGSRPSLGDCALGPYIKLLQQLGFPDFPEIPDPTRSPGRLATWWQALQSHDQCRAALDEYGNAVAEFLVLNRATITRHS